MSFKKQCKNSSASRKIEKIYFSLYTPLGTTKNPGHYMHVKQAEDSETWREGRRARDLRNGGTIK